jgi:hypothetical protein
MVPQELEGLGLLFELNREMVVRRLRVTNPHPTGGTRTACVVLSRAEGLRFHLAVPQSPEGLWWPLS